MSLAQIYRNRDTIYDIDKQLYRFEAINQPVNEDVFEDVIFDDNISTGSYNITLNQDTTSFNVRGSGLYYLAYRLDIADNVIYDIITYLRVNDGDNARYYGFQAYGTRSDPDGSIISAGVYVYLNDGDNFSVVLRINRDDQIVEGILDFIKIR